MRKTVEIDIDFFTHLLKCMAEQKDIHKLPEEEAVEKQMTIDNALQYGTDLVRSVLQKEEASSELLKKCYEKFTNDLVLIGDIIKLKGDDPEVLTEAVFKWGLVRQECEMYCIIGEVVNKKEFYELCETRGFDKDMRQYIIGMMKYVGLGDNLQQKG